MAEQLTFEREVRYQRQHADPIATKIRRMIAHGSTETEAAGWALAAFLQTPRTEAAFYLRFQTLPAARRQALHTYWHEPDTWRAFARLLRFYRL